MLYHWGGRHLLLDSVVEGKRTAVDHLGRARPCAFDVRRWILPPEDETMGRLWQRISRRVRRYLSQQRRSPRDSKAKAVWQFVVEQISTTKDTDDFDFWQFPSETLALGTGDCEDKSFLCASLLLAAGIPGDRVRVTIGAICSSTVAKSLEGHAWTMYRDSRGSWRILEANVPHLPIRVGRGPAGLIKFPRRRPSLGNTLLLSADQLASDVRAEQYVPLVCFNHQSVWTVEETKPGSLVGAQKIHPNWDRHPTFDQILRARK